MSARCRSASPGVSRIHGTDESNESLARAAPAGLADQAVADVGVPIPARAALEDRVVGVDEGEPLSEPSSTQLVGEAGDLAGIVDAIPVGEEMRGVERDAQTAVADLGEELLGLGGERGHGAACPGHQLDQHADVVRGHGSSERLGGGPQGAERPAGRPPCVNDEQADAQLVARARTEASTSVRVFAMISDSTTRRCPRTRGGDARGQSRWPSVFRNRSSGANRGGAQALGLETKICKRSALEPELPRSPPRCPAPAPDVGAHHA